MDTMNSPTCKIEQEVSDTYQQDVDHAVLRIVYISVGYFAAAYICVFCWNLTGEQLAQRLLKG